MKTIPRILPASFLLLATVSAQEVLAGSCGSNRCNATYVAPYVPSAPGRAERAGHRIRFTRIHRDRRKQGR